MQWTGLEDSPEFEEAHRVLDLAGGSVRRTRCGPGRARPRWLTAAKTARLKLGHAPCDHPTRVARTIDYTIAYESGNGEAWDLCKILFGGDGSYYVTAPYHPLNRAMAAKVTVNYANPDGLFSLEHAEELAVVDDDDRRLKLSHHLSGFLQFSGEGILSGRDESGAPKGIGTLSWPLTEPTLGPSFQLAFSDPRACGRVSARKARTIVLPEVEIEHMRRGLVGLTVLGYYFPLAWREFVYRGHDGGSWLNLLHPNAQAMKPLRVALAAVDCGFPGLIGLEARPHGLEARDGGASFFLTSATGQIRRNWQGELLGDQLLCAYPMPDLSDAELPSLNYRLPTPPYTAPPGTIAIDPSEQ